MTKRLFSVAAALLIALSLVVVSFAEGEQWNTEFDRVNDLVEVMDRETLAELESSAIENLEKYEMDLFVALFDESKFAEGDDISSYSEWLYEHNGFGYGETHDGLMLGIDTVDNTFKLLTFGAANEVFTQPQLYCLDISVKKGYANDGYAGAIREFIESAAQLAEFYSLPLAHTEQDHGEGYDYPASSLDAHLPVYVDDLDVDFSDNSSLPRVLDYADLFTDEQEEQIAGAIAGITDEHQKDVVVLTVNGTDGQSHDIYNADFYDYCFYGGDKEHSGMSLLISMDPEDRGFYTTCTGVVQGMYTERIANSLDDLLFDYMKAGVNGDPEAFGRGVMDWLGHVETFFAKGDPFAPDWMVSDIASIKRFNSEDAPRIVDDSNTLSAQELGELETKLRQMGEEFGVDIVIHTAPQSYNLTNEEYAEAFYKANGYGYGSGYDGICYILFTSQRTVVSYTEGKGTEITDEEHLAKIKEAAESMSESGKQDKAVDRLIRFTEKYLKTGRVPTTVGRWTARGVFSLLLALISSSVIKSRAEASMKNVEAATNANAWVVPGSYALTYSQDRYIDTTTTSVRKPPETKSTPSSSSGGSSYSSSYSGSSGTSHSGSGRSF